MSEYMIFCLGEGKNSRKGEGYQKKYRVFNKNVSEEEYKKTKKSLPIIRIPLIEYIQGDVMSDDEKVEHPEWEQFNGYLKVRSYHEAWAIYWKRASQEDKDKILNIKQFDAKIFKKITGISCP